MVLLLIVEIASLREKGHLLQKAPRVHLQSPGCACTGSHAQKPSPLHRVLKPSLSKTLKTFLQKFTYLGKEKSECFYRKLIKISSFASYRSLRSALPGLENADPHSSLLGWVLGMGAGGKRPVSGHQPESAKAMRGKRIREMTRHGRAKGFKGQSGTNPPLSRCCVSDLLVLVP